MGLIYGLVESILNINKYISFACFCTLLFTKNRESLRVKSMNTNKNSIYSSTIKMTH